MDEHRVVIVSDGSVTIVVLGFMVGVVSVDVQIGHMISTMLMAVVASVVITIVVNGNVFNCHLDVVFDVY